MNKCRDDAVNEKKYELKRVTFSCMEINAKNLKEAQEIFEDIDGDDDRWVYYKEEGDVCEVEE